MQKEELIIIFYVLGGLKIFFEELF